RGVSRLDPSQRCLRGRTGPAGGLVLFTATPLAKAFLTLAAHDLDELLHPRAGSCDDPARLRAGRHPAPGPQSTAEELHQVAGVPVMGENTDHGDLRAVVADEGLADGDENVAALDLVVPQRPLGLRAVFGDGQGDTQPGVCLLEV